MQILSIFDFDFDVKTGMTFVNDVRDPNLIFMINNGRKELLRSKVMNMRLKCINFENITTSFDHEAILDRIKTLETNPIRLTFDNYFGVKSKKEKNIF